jgi:cyclic pyranopterin phosphate synthase
MKKFSHLDRSGKARMVDVSGKTATRREAVARGSISMKKATLALIRKNQIAKGDVLGTARIAAIMAAKKTPDVIPLCHPLPIASVGIDFVIDEAKGRITLESRVKVTGQTGVEMEALTAVSAAALTIYDMCKAVDKEMVISDIMLIEKTGGKSGPFRRSGAS